MNFRTDIAGLRAWAVLLVVLYHFGVPGSAAGFIGVDIFFVISGFLMGGILDRVLRDPQRKRLWALDFVLARAQRIWPALFVMLALWMIWGWLRLGADDYRGIALEGLRAMTFRSNDFYAAKADYFAPALELRLFLHSWSLSAEWMFYLGLAGLALALSWHRMCARALIVVVALLSAASFVWMLVLRAAEPTEAFFFLSARAWEMGAGVLAFHLARIWQPSTRAAMLEGAGISLILACILVLPAGGSWPGPVTLLPVVGTALILIGARQNSWILAPRPLQGLGEISYSLYLWHWPISVALAHAGMLHDPMWQVIGIALSLLAGGLSWVLVERPTRRALTGRSRIVKAAALLSAFVATGLVLGAVRKLDGFPRRLPDEVHLEIARITMRDELDRACVATDGAFRPCVIGKGDVPDMLIFGDSHAGAMLGAIAASDLADNSRIDTWLQSGCQPIFETRNRKGPTECATFLTAAEAEIKAAPASAPLLIIGRLPWLIEGENGYSDRIAPPEEWITAPYLTRSPAYRAEMAQGLSEGICRIGAGRRTVVVAPVPELRQAPAREMEAAFMRGEAFSPPFITRAEHEARTAVTLEALRQARRSCGIEIIEAADLLCDADVCSSNHAGDYTYRDDDHLSLFGAQLLIPRLETVLSAR